MTSLTREIGAVKDLRPAQHVLHKLDCGPMSTKRSLHVERSEVLQTCFWREFATHVCGQGGDPRCQERRASATVRENYLDVGISSFLACYDKMRCRLERFVRYLGDRKSEKCMRIRGRRWSLRAVDEDDCATPVEFCPDRIEEIVANVDCVLINHAFGRDCAN